MFSIDGRRPGAKELRSSEVLASDDDWMQSVRSGRFWREQPSAPAPAVPTTPRRKLRSYRAAPPPPPPFNPKPEASAETYRTMCVRLCDGYAWPISFATASSSFDRDQKICEQSCSAPAKLYSYPNPGGEMEDMVDLSGKRYSDLPSAYAYQAVYNDSCKCRAHPWEKESLERHRVYALQTRARKGDRQAGAELRALKASSAPPRGSQRKSRRRR